MARVEADSLRRLPEPNKYGKVLRIGLAVALLGSGGAVGSKMLLDRLSQTETGATEQQPGGIMPSQQDFDKLVTATPTSAPPPIETPKPTATAEATPTPKPEKSPLGYYEVIKAEMRNEKTDASEGNIVIVSTPNEDGSDQILAYAVLKNGSKMVFQARPQRISDQKIEVFKPGGFWGLIDVTYDPIKKTLAGRFVHRTKDGTTWQTIENYPFQGTFTGTGKNDAYKAINEINSEQFGSGNYVKAIDGEFQFFQVSLP